MPWTLVGQTSGVIANGAITENVAVPAGAQQDDIIVFAISADLNPEGYDLTGVQSGADYPLDVNLAGGTPSFGVAVQRMGAIVDTEIEVDLINGRAAPNGWIIQVWRGADTSTALDNGVQQYSSGSAEVLPQAPAYTTLTDGALLFAIVGLDDEFVEGTATAPAGYSNLAVKDSDPALGRATLLIASKEIAVAGAQPAVTFGGTDVDQVNSASFALRPAAGGGTEEEGAGTSAGAATASATAAATATAAGTSAGVATASASASGSAPAAGTAAGTATASASGAALTAASASAAGTATAAATAASGPQAMVINVTGQSNSTTASTSGTDKLPDEYLSIANTFIVYRDGVGGFEIQAYQAGVNSNPSQVQAEDDYGSEAGFAYRYRLANPSVPIYIVKEGVPGTGFGANDWNPGDEKATNWRDRRRLLADYFHAEGITSWDEVNLWNQGEHETNDADWPSNYATAYTAFEAWARDEVYTPSGGSEAPLWHPDMVWITERIRPYTDDGVRTTAAPWERTAQVREGYYVARAASISAGHVHRIISIDQDREDWTFLHPVTQESAKLLPNTEPNPSWRGRSGWVPRKGEDGYLAFTDAYTEVDVDRVDPSAFAFTDLSDQVVDSVVTSDRAEPDIQRRSTISITGGEYRLHWPAQVRGASPVPGFVAVDWTSESGTIEPYQEIELRTTAAVGTTDVTVTVGETASVWTVEALGNAAVGTSAGASTAAGASDAAGEETAEGAAAGAATASAVGRSTNAAAGASAGAATAAAAGLALAAAAGSSVGASTASAAGSQAASGEGSGSAAGVAAATASGAALSAAAGTGAGSATVAATGSQAASGSGAGASAGLSLVAGTGASLAAASATAGGSAVASGTGRATAAALGSASGSAAATAAGSSVTGWVGSAAGMSTAAAVAISLAATAGSAAGLATVAANSNLVEQVVPDRRRVSFAAQSRRIALSA